MGPRRLRQAVGAHFHVWRGDGRVLLQGCGRAGRAGCFVFITVFYSFMSFRAVRTSSWTAVSSADSSASNFPWWMP